VNAGPGIPLTLFVACSTFALFALLAPSAFVEFVLPFGLTGPGVEELLVGGLVGANAGAALLMAAYLLQDLPIHREGLRRGSLVVALGSLGLTGLATVGPLRWVTLLTPLALGGLVLSAAVEWRARTGRPAFGLKAVGIATAPLFLGVLLAMVRIVQVVQLAHG
jgi:hypothetical protein